MILRREDIQEKSAKILSAIDTSEVSSLSDTVEMICKDNYLYLSVTNREYLVEIKIDLGSHEDFHATVSATLFLKLIAQTTSDTIELSVKDNALIVKGNGTYKLPLLYDEDKILSIPKIEVENASVNMQIPSSTLNDIMKFNGKEIQKTTAIARPVQKMYYMDEQGAITFTTGACVNKFSLTTPVKILMSGKLVKLFKLFSNGDVNFTLGHTALTNEIMQTRVKFELDDVVITAILACDDAMLNSVPAKAIRSRAEDSYAYEIKIDRLDLLQTINRISLFTVSGFTKPYCSCKFTKDSVTIYDGHSINHETIYYEESKDFEEEYTAILDLNDVKAVLDVCTEQYVTMRFGNKQAVCICYNNIINVIPEIVSK